MDIIGGVGDCAGTISIKMIFFLTPSLAVFCPILLVAFRYDIHYSANGAMVDEIRR